MELETWIALAELGELAGNSEADINTALFPFKRFVTER